ncbi:poly(ethylene terephthalate) hydrolase family protein [Thalassiella azotivora]
MSTLTATTRRSTRRLAQLAAGAVVASTALVGGSLPAHAANPYERGPAPTEGSIEARTGPFRVATESVSSWTARGFGGGTIYYPTDTSQGTFGVVAVSPGFTAGESSIAWLGDRIASQGFVVITFDTNSRYDQPGSRADQLQAALDHVTQRSGVRNRVDANRQAVMGHSMGGGGSLEASTERRTLRASVPLTPWHTTKRFTVSTPQLIVGAENDSVASVRSHAIPFYENLPSTTSRAYLELDGASHFAPNTSNTTIAKFSISWLKRFVDDDTRYSQFLTGGPNRDDDTSDWRTGGAL